MITQQEAQLQKMQRDYMSDLQKWQGMVREKDEYIERVQLELQNLRKTTEDQRGDFAAIITTHDELLRSVCNECVM